MRAPQRPRLRGLLAAVPPARLGSVPQRGCPASPHRDQVRARNRGLLATAAGRPVASAPRPQRAAARPTRRRAHAALASTPPRPQPRSTIRWPTVPMSIPGVFTATRRVRTRGHGCVGGSSASTSVTTTRRSRRGRPHAATRPAPAARAPPPAATPARPLMPRLNAAAALGARFSSFRPLRPVTSTPSGDPPARVSSSGWSMPAQHSTTCGPPRGCDESRPASPARRRRARRDRAAPRVVLPPRPLRATRHAVTPALPRPRSRHHCHLS